MSALRALALAISLMVTLAASTSTARADELRSARRLRAAGMGTAIAGTVVTALGASFVIYTMFSRDYHFDRDPGAFELAMAGVGLIGAGQGITVVGIPLWAVGSARANAPQMSLSAGGLSVRF